VKRRHKRWLAIASAIVAAAYVAIVAPVNLCVIALGGSPHLLSPYYYRAKVHALGRFAIHCPKDVFGDHGDPKKLIVAAAKRHRVPPDLALRVAEAESTMEPHQVSHAGAMGMMQLMPATAKQYGVSDPFDSEQSIDAGVRYLSWLWKRYRGDRMRVVAAYNAGPAAVPRTGPLDLPGETKAYLRRVLR
jgi:hypothetical protein